MNSLPHQDSVKISLVIPASLLKKIDESAKAFYVSRAVYIRRVLAQATEADEPRVHKAMNRFRAPTADTDLGAYLDELVAKGELEYE
jgi:metal-responsive CopG/Arc/MetJ family transcriptional regulator